MSGRLIGTWLDELARILAGRGPAIRPWRGMLLRRGDGFEVHLRQGRSARVVAVLQDGASLDVAEKVAAELKRNGATSDSLVLRLAPDAAIQSRLSLPAGVRNMLGPVIRNQLERLAPWPAEQSLFAFREAGLSADGTLVDVDLWIAGRARTEALLAGLQTAGLAPGVVDVGTSPEPDPVFNMIGKAGPDIARSRRIVGRTLAAGAAATALVVGGSLAFAWHQGRERDDLSATLQRELRAAAVSPREAELRKQREKVLGERRQTPSTAIAIEVLSRALPDTAYLERFELAEGTITLAGKASQVPALIGLLEETGHFTDIRFAAPTTRRPGETLDDFSLSMRVRPALTLEKGR
jgi:general secretion pathway protein L